VLLGYTQMLLDSEGGGGPIAPAERGETLGRMLSCGRTLADLVEDTLSVLRLEAGAAAVELGPLSLVRSSTSSGQPPRPLGRLEAERAATSRSGGSSIPTFRRW
jgi:signal transduction histidine kinase